MATDSIAVTHVAGAAVAVAAINWLKHSPYFPWITQQKTNVMRVVALVAAAITGIGIHYAWNADTRVLSFNIPTIAAMFGIVVGYVKSLAIQELTYQATKRPNLAELADAVADALKKSAAPIVVAFVLLVAGCAVRHLPDGTTAKATNFEQILAWNAAAAQANDGFADNVIALQRGGAMGIPEAKTILVTQAKIAEADKRITARISAAATCAAQQAGTNATAVQLDAAAATCAQISAPGLAADINVILGSISDLNSAGLVAVKDPAKRQALTELLGTIQALVQKIYGTLESQGVIK